jgi:RES domain
VTNVQPPAAYAQAPALTTLGAGTTVFRIHHKHFPADAFNPVPSHKYYGGGRFDATQDDHYPFMYAGSTVDVAVAETLLRDLAPDPAGIRQLPWPRVAGRRISSVEVTADLELVSLRSAADLGAVAQDTWLTSCDPRDYAQSRHWAHWIRSHASGAAGYVWLSRREPGAAAYVLFGDRVPATAIAASAHPDVPPGDEADFDTPRGRRALRNRLTRYNVALSRR